VTDGRKNKRLKVAVLTGGISRERDISLESGRCVAEALTDGGIEVLTFDVSPGELSILDDGSFDVFFLALHGEFGEDGQLQQLLEDKSLCYTGSGSVASKLAFDKLDSKKRFVEAGIATPRWVAFDGELDERQLARLGEKFVVKPVRQGSTIGISIVDGENVFAVAKRCLEEFGDCMIEEYIGGRELTVGVLDDEPLAVIEIRTKTGFYDYQAKYVDKETEYLFDTLDARLSAKLQRDAMKCFEVLGLRGFARIDFILGSKGERYVLEANTLPGMTDHSLLPKAAAKKGLSMSQLCVRIVESAFSGKTIRVD